MKIWQILAVLLLCLVLVGSLSCNVLSKSANKQSEATVEQVKVVRGDLTITVTGTGKTSVNNEMKLSFETSKGKIVKIYVKVGDEVTKGKTLAELTPLDTDVLELAVAKAKVARDQAEANLYDLKELQRASYQKVKIAQSQLEAAELELAQAQKKLQKETITAPFNGAVASIAVEEGDIVTAGEAIIHLIDIRTMQLVVEVDEIDIPKTKLNQKALITLDALPGARLNGIVTAISPLPVQKTGVVVYEVTIGLNPPEVYNLKVGMSATADIIVSEKRNVLLVPTRAIRQDKQGKPMLMVLVDGQAQPRLIVTGLSDGAQTEIAEGVSQGETVVIPVQPKTAPSSRTPMPPMMFPAPRR